LIFVAVADKNRNSVFEDRIKELESQLAEAQDTLEAMRTGQVDALVVNNGNGPTLYTLESADLAYRIFIEKMAEGAVTLNTTGLVLYSNSRFATMVGQPLINVIGASFLEFVAPEDQLHFKHLLEGGWQHNVKSEITLSAPQRSLPVQLSISPLDLEGVVSLNITITDLSEQNKNQQQLKEKNELLERLNEALAVSNHDLQQFASIASHDLQEPIRKIQVYSKFIKDKNLDGLTEESKMHLEK